MATGSRALPQPTPETQHFWDGTKAGELRLKFEERPETFDILAEMAADGICEFPAPLNAALRARLIGDMVEIDGRQSLVETNLRFPFVQGC